MNADHERLTSFSLRNALPPDSETTGDRFISLGLKNNTMEDIYIAIEFSKREESIGLFTQKYLKGFKETNGYYEYPPFSDETEFETDDYKLMLSYVLQKEKSNFRFYFANAANKETPFAMMCLNEDGSLFLGLGVYPQFASKYEQKLKKDFKSSLIMFCYHTIPPDNLTEFKSVIKGNGGSRFDT